MSMQIDVELNCQKCGNSFYTKLYKTIWGEYPENRELVMSDQINIVRCPHCGMISRVVSSLFYTNSKDEFAVWYEPVPDPMIDKDTEGYKRMISPDCYLATAPRIKDWDEFKETIKQFETGARKSTGSPSVESVFKKFFSKFKP